MEYITYNKRFIDISGNKYGKLLVKGCIGKDKDGKTIWECLCECGKTTIQNKSNLQRKPPKGIRSCGCLRSEYTSNKHWQGVGEISKNCWSSVRRGAKSRNIPFNISIEEMWNLFVQQNNKCALTGITIKLSRNSKRQKPTASLDRINPNEGYIKENCQWVHKIVNLCKHTLTNQEFIDLCKQVVEYKNENCSD